MKRRILKQLRSKPDTEQHHNVYVVLLDPAVGRVRRVRAENPKRDRRKPCVYVGLSAIGPSKDRARGISSAILPRLVPGSEECRNAGQSHPKLPQSHSNATPMRPQSQE
jgi:hypothetical protein